MATNRASNFVIPGYSFNTNIGRTNFHRSQHFDVKGDVQVLADKPLPKAYGAPSTHVSPQLEPLCSMYIRKKVLDMPAWITLDKKVLCFDAYFQESIEAYQPTYQVRRCKIYFFLEDGTVKITEMKVRNSGIPQGTLLSRQRVPFPPPKDQQFYDVIDFNVGHEVEIYGKVFKIIDCDQFSRHFLGRMGVMVPEAIAAPVDPRSAQRHQAESFVAQRVHRAPSDFVQFLKHDGQILTFYGYWDDRESDTGYIHQLKINYYLADDTIEVLEVMPESGGRSATCIFLRRCKVPKQFGELPGPGRYCSSTLLNVFWSVENRARSLQDRLSVGAATMDYYKPEDLAVGAVIEVYGRKVVLYDCDNYTKRYYRAKHGVEDFAAGQVPQVEPAVQSVPLRQRRLPPWNGFGSYEDSAQNCVTVEPKQIMRDVRKFHQYDRDGYNSHVLRFSARMLTGGGGVQPAHFIVSYYLVDDTICVFERNVDSCTSGVFLRRQMMPLPGQNLYGSEPPEHYKASDLYVGARLTFNGFHFQLVDGDEYALRYMELHPNEFPKSNITAVMSKVRERLSPTYKDFIAKNIGDRSPTIDYYKLSAQLSEVMGADWTPHEMLTIARHFRVAREVPVYSRKLVQQLAHTQLRKTVWSDLDRTKEYFHKQDLLHRGYLSRKEAYTVMRACRVPLSIELINRILDFTNQNEHGDLQYEDIFNFLDDSKCHLPDRDPPHPLHNPCDVPPTIERTARLIDWCAFTKFLDLDSTFEHIEPGTQIPAFASSQQLN